MWLLYFRFDDDGTLVTMHVRCRLKRDAAAILKRAQQRGLTATAKLAEYAFFGARGTIQPYHVPNFHYMLVEEFERRWQKGDG